jgi:hypothetical protein
VRFFVRRFRYLYCLHGDYYHQYHHHHRYLERCGPDVVWTMYT